MKKTCMPGAYTLMAAGVIDSDDPLNLGMVGMHGCRTSNFALDYADVMVAVGTRFSDRVALAPDAFGRRAKLIQIDIDPSEVNKNVGVDVSLMGDVKDVICALLPKLHQTCRDEWLAQIAEWKQEDYHPEDSNTTLKPHQVIRKVNEMAGTDAIYVTDVGQHQMWAAQYLHHVKPRHFLTSGGLGTMGFGYGAAIGAKIARPEKRVVLFTGDGSFHMNMNEACTAVSFGLPVITVILDNHVLGMVRQWQTSFYGKRYSCTDLNRRTDYVKVIEGFGGKGFHCNTLADLEKAFEENRPVSEILPECSSLPEEDIRDLSSRFFHFLHEKNVFSLLNTLFSSEHFPDAPMTGRKANQLWLSGKGEKCPLAEAEGRTALEAVLPYPPGICLLAAGETWTKDILSYFLFLEEYGREFPSFMPEVVGLHKQDGKPYVWVLSKDRG